MRHRRSRFRRGFRAAVTYAASSLAGLLLVAPASLLAEPTRSSSPAMANPFPAEPSLDVTGRVASPPPFREAGIAGAAPEPVASEAAVPSERDVNVPPAPPSPGAIDPSVLAQEIKERSSTLQDCRVDVARQQHRNWSHVTAGRVILRWTILPSGTVSRAEVVALDPAEPGLLDCVKQRMVGWAFTPPVGGSLPVERTISFRTPQGKARRQPTFIPPAPLTQRGER